MALVLTTRGHASIPQRRSILLCLDSADEGVSQNTNVTQFFSLLQKGFIEKQLVLYHNGVEKHFIQRFGKATDRSQVLTIYQFLSDNYRMGDRISILGQGRGAHIGGLLCRMIHNVGIVKPGDNNRELSESAYKHCFSGDGKNDARENFKSNYSVGYDIKVAFFGVWNTNPHTDYIPPPGSVHVFRHALALDERHPGLKRPAEWFPTMGTQIDGRKKKPNDRKSVQNRPKDVLEVWFPGVHDDLCGSSREDKLDTPSLSHLSLRWMVRQCLKADRDVQLNDLKRKEFVIDIENLTLDPSLSRNQLELHSEIIKKVLKDIKAKSRYPVVPAVLQADPLGSHGNDVGNQSNITSVITSPHEAEPPSNPMHSKAQLTLPTSNDDQNNLDTKRIQVGKLSLIEILKIRGKKSKRISLPGLEGSLEQTTIPQDHQNDPDFYDALCLPQNDLKAHRDWRSFWRGTDDAENLLLSLNIRHELNLNMGSSQVTEERQDGPSGMNVHQSVCWRKMVGNYLADSSFDGTGEKIADLVTALRNYEPRIQTKEPNWVPS